MNLFLKHRGNAGIRASLAMAVCFFATGAARARPSPWPRPPRPSSRACSRTCCRFKKASGIDVKVVAVGTGQAIDMAKRGDADVLFVHDTAAEEKFVAEGFSAAALPGDVQRLRAGRAEGRPGRHVKGSDIVAALKKIAAANAPFVSRGDKSGTDAAEKRYWTQAGVAEASRCPTRQGGYKECGCGMGPALNIAASSGAYVLADRGTWLSFKNRADLAVLVEGDKRLFNQYGVMVVSPAKYPHAEGGRARRSSSIG
jgi:tungstate transport system substrate-binding protein